MYRLAHAFPALQSLELFSVDCKALSPDRALISIRTCGRLFAHLKLDGGYQPEFYPISWSTLTHLDLSLKWLSEEGLTFASCTSLERLSVKVSESDGSDFFSHPGLLQGLDALMGLGLPKSLRALEITLDKSLAYFFGLEGSSDQQTALRNFTRLVTDHIFLGTTGVKIIVGNSTQNLVNMWRASLERTFASLHELKLLRVEFVYSEGFSPELYGHPTEVEHLTISRDGSQIVIFRLLHIEQEGYGPDSEPQETGTIEASAGEAIVASSWSPDSTQILALMVPSIVLHVWDAEDLTLIRSLRCPSFPLPFKAVRMSINTHYALIHFTGQDRFLKDRRPDDKVYVINLVSGETHPRLVDLQVVSQAVLQCGSEPGEFTVLALTKDGTLVVDRGEEDPRSSSTAPPAPSPLFGFTPEALSADGTRALCFVGAVSSFREPLASAPRFCVVDTTTGEILSGPFGGDRPSVIIGEYPSMDIDRRRSSPYRGGWFWSTQHGRLYRTLALDHEQNVGRVAVTHDGSMVGWSDRRGVVHFHRNVGDDATLIPGRVKKSEGAGVKLRKSDERTNTRGKDVQGRRGGGRGRDTRTRKRGGEDKPRWKY
ncbi:uncharacterized protein BXZ73DRAFT_77208 [Epithele typhae]|uniref:uncharacterized protein n=1 Tax=Epithele typhae TaxID=378194 RepID=UPI002007A3F4|nr:uncharacterized protein BXZ73DRAFT_77208 [Epithele typhae]KAH9933584.1 hypothetical protein BXZ73DRAFT_77208 [Epithele typhae]